MATSSTFSCSTTVGSEHYPCPTHVNATSFMSIKLSGESNYLAWKAQMKCLLDSHDMLGFINGSNANADDRDWERSDKLVKGWIFGSLSEDVMKTVADLGTAKEVWDKLEVDYTVSHRTEENFDKYNELCSALQLGEWEKAQALLEQEEDAKTAKLNSYGHMSLHVAIGNPNDTQVLIGLMTLIPGDDLPNLVDDLGQNALHYAALLGNAQAAQTLVATNRDLLHTFDNDNNLPIHKAIINSHKEAFEYLLKEHLNNNQGRNVLFEGESGALLLCETIMAGFLGVACDLLQHYHQLAHTVPRGRVPPLCCIAIKQDSYPSAKRYNFYQRFVYSRLDKYDPLCRALFAIGLDKDALRMEEWENARNFLNLHEFTWTTNQNSDDHRELHSENENLSQDGNQATDIETSQETNHANQREIHSNNEYQATNYANPVTGYMKHCVNYVTEKIIRKLWEGLRYLTEKIRGKFWNLLLLPLPHIKSIKKDKMEHGLALIILRFICDQVSKLPSDQDKHYEEAYFKVVINNTLEVVELITTKYPQSILMENSAGYMLPQLSIINRSEKIYNFFVHKEVKNIIHPKDREAMNENEETPIMLFRKAHAELRKEGEVWPKKVADSYTITAVLIITIVFAAAITVPGGTKENGTTNYKTTLSFTIFLFSDAISLFTSTIALLFSLSILTARYAEKDFLYKLPNKLMFGIVMLFISVTMMLIAFGAALHIMFGQDNLSILLIIIAITCIPIAIFVVLQLRLLVDLISPAYGNGIFRKRSELRITS